VIGIYGAVIVFVSVLQCKVLVSITYLLQVSGMKSFMN